MNKLKPAVDDDGRIRGYVFQCPGCGHGHIFYTIGSVTWQFNGDLNAPTFTPSLLNRATGQSSQDVCHLNLTNGKVIFHKDCTHAWKGKTYDLPDVK